MLELHPPTFDVSHVLSASASGGRMTAVHAAVSALQANETQYQQLASSAALWTYPVGGSAGILGPTASSVSWAYDNRLSSKRSNARFFYDQLRQAAPYGLCATCTARDAAALDHHLPRESFPELAIQPTNLTPICTQCNTAKSTTMAASANEQFLHPYFDRLGSVSWLEAQVKQEPTSPLVFKVASGPRWTASLRARIDKHFEDFGLAALFSTKSAALLSNHRVAFELALEAAPAAESAKVVKTEALRMALSYASSGHAPWAAAAFEAWGNSAFFCAGGWQVDNDSGLQGAVDRID